jgi:cytochrome P450
VFYYYLGGAKRVLVASDPQILRRVLKDNAANYAKSDIQVERIGQFAGEGLVTDRGAHWLRKRRLMQRAFRQDRLAAMAPDMQAALDEFLVAFEARARAGPVDLASEMNRMALTLIMRSLFSVRLSPEDAEMISSGIDTLQRFVVRQILHPYLAKWFEISGELDRHLEIRSQVDRVLETIVDGRHAHPDHDDFLQILIDADPADLGYRFSPQQILNESVHMLVAGHETSSNVLTWLLHLLSLDRECAARIRDELHRVAGDGPLGANHLADLPLTTAAIEEAMRLFPPFWMIDRTAIEDDEAGGFPIPAGTTVIAFIYGAHHDPQRWAEPERFMPGRYAGDAIESRSGFDYLPFGAGPRTCLGFQYSMIQMTVILSTLVRRFRFSAVEPTLMKPRGMLSLRPREEIRMRFEAVA